jgi:hypothetical protein
MIIHLLPINTICVKVNFIIIKEININFEINYNQDFDCNDGYPAGHFCQESMII